MLSENIKNLRKEKGMSQEELANKLNVVRQTVSKWEQNLSVPDSEMLVRLSEVFEVPVNRLIGETIEVDDTKSELREISLKLENLNAMIAERNARSRRIWLRIVAFGLIAISVIIILYVAPYFSSLWFMSSMSESAGIIGGADEPTTILVSSGMDWFGVVFLAALSVLIIVFSIYLLKKAQR